MKLICNSSSSSGNSYVLVSKEDSLVIEAGVPLMGLKKSLNFDLSKVSGCICSHEHFDHSRYAKEYTKAGIDVYASTGTLDALNFSTWGSQHRTHVVFELQYFMVGSFKVMPFKIKHDAKEPMGYLIQHEECGVCLFLTDTYYCPYKFKGLNNLLIECNFSDEILENNILNGAVHPATGNRVRESHMSLEILKDLLKANDLSAVCNIVLIHLSAQNSNAKQFQKEIAELTGKTVSVADKGMEIEFSRFPF